MTSHSSRSAQAVRAARYLQKRTSTLFLDPRHNQAAAGMINVQGPVFMTPLSQKGQLSQSAVRSGTTGEIKYENTYKMAPSNAFPETTIKRLVEKILIRELKDAKYEPDDCRQLTTRISDIVKSQIKDLELERYKLVCIVHIGQRGNQEVKVGSRCLWDVKLDTYTSVEYQNTSLFAIATVFGIYFE